MTSRHTDQEWAAKIRLFAKVNAPYIFDSEEEARNVYKLLNKKKFKISKNIIWKIV